MSDKTFVDTNVLVYAHNVEAGTKHEAAKYILRELWDGHIGVLSPQVLQEFYVNLTRKISRPISKESARLVVGSYTIWCVDTTAAEISRAFRIEGESRIGSQERCHSDSVGRSELRQGDRGHTDSKPFREQSLGATVAAGPQLLVHAVA
jgi:predicted nucleic acid-binding protein